MEVARKKAVADAEFYSKQRQASANQMLLTNEFLELKRIEAIAANSKVYFGSDIPSMFIEGTGAPHKTVGAAAVTEKASGVSGDVSQASVATGKPASSSRFSQVGDASATPATAAGGGTSEKR